MSHQLNLSTGRGSCSSPSFRVARTDAQLSFHEFPFPFAPFRACIYTGHHVQRQLSPLPRGGRQGKWRRIVARAQNWRPLLPRRDLASSSPSASTRKMARARATKHVYERGKRIWHNNWPAISGIHGGVCTLFSMVSAPGPLFRRPSTRKLGGTNERASFILLITSEFAPIVGIKFVRFVSMNETHCRGISPAFLPPPLSLFRNVNREDSIRIERLLDS